MMKKLDQNILKNSANQRKENNYRLIMKKKLSEKHPVLGLLLFTYGGFIVAEFLIGVVAALVLSEFGFDTRTTAAVSGCIGSILVLILWYLINQPKYRFMPRKGEISGSFKLILIPMLVYWAMIFGFFAYFCKGFPFAPIGMREFFMAVMAGLVEEVCFREIAVSYMAKRWMSEKNIPLIAIASGVLFGLTHITNVLGNELIDTLYQVVLCILTGVFYAAIYLRKGNVWVLCLFHSVHDILTFMASAGVTAKGVTEIPDWYLTFVVAIEFVLCLYGFFLIRKAKRQEIIDLWDYKWSRN